jgi:cobalt-zinc-cadmium efflux system outer membrane protein
MRSAAYWLALPLAAAAWGQAAQERLNIDDLVAEALRANPEILAAQSKYEAARQRPAQERSLPEPTFSLGWNSSGSPLPGAGLGTEPIANVGAMASQEIPYPGKLRLRAAVAEKEADIEAQQFHAVELNVISRVKQAYYRLQHAYAMLGVLARNRDALRTLLRAAEARYSVGKTTQADVFKAQTQLTVIETRIAQIERERTGREAEINALLNRRPGTPVTRPGEPHMMSIGFTIDELLAKARDAAPALAREQKVMERANTALRLARTDYYPDFTVNGGYYYMGSMPPMYMFRADIKLPLRRAKTRAEITERSEEIAQARHTYEAAARDLEFRIQDEYTAAKTAQTLLDLYARTVIPQARLAVESSLASYETGATDFLTVLSNHVAAFEYEMNYHEQMQEYHLALARLEELIGVELIK